MLLLAWIFGLYPEWEAIVGSLSGKLATKIGAKIRGIIGCDKYQDVFPGVLLSKHTNSKTEFAVVNSKNEREGYFFASGRNTRATGQGAGVLFLDDIIGEKETDSVAAIEDAREAIQMWRSRGAPDGFHWIICNTRYREDDPIGFVLAEYQSDGPWDMVVLPVIIERGEEKEYVLDDGTVWRREEDDVLWKYTLKTIKALQEGLMRRAPHEWFGQYKGLPRPPGGRKVNPADILRYPEAVSALRQRCDRVTVIVDTAKRDQDQNDPSAILCIGQIGDRHYVLDALVERLLLPFLEVALARFCLLWRPHKCLIELTANGEALRDGLEKRGYAIDTSKSPHEKVPWRTPIEGVEVAGQGSKVLRFEAVVPGAVKRGALWVPESAPWASAFIGELANFPKGHDDQCIIRGMRLPVLRDGFVHDLAVEEVVLGDQLLTHKGRWRPVTKVFVNEHQGPVFEIRPNGQVSATVTPNHPIWTSIRHQPGIVKQPQRWRTGPEMKKTLHSVYEPVYNERVDPPNFDLASFHKEKESRNAAGLNMSSLICTEEIVKYNNPKAKAVPRYITPDIDLMRLFGYYCAEGSTNRHQFVFSFGNKETDLHADVENIIAQKFKLSVSRYTNTATTVYCSSVLLSRFFSSLFGSGAKNKKVPGWLLNLQDDLILAFLRGAFLGNGCVTKTSLIYTTSSRSLAVGFRLLLQKVGAPCTMDISRPNGCVAKIQGRTVTCAPLYHLRVLGPAAVVLAPQLGFSIEKAGEEHRCAKYEDGLIKRNIRELKQSKYTGKVYNFEVEEDHTYQVGGMLVHNCDCTAIYYKWVDENEGIYRNTRPVIPAAVLAAASPAGGISRSGVGPFGHSKRW